MVSEGADCVQRLDVLWLITKLKDVSLAAKAGLPEHLSVLLKAPKKSHANRHSDVHQQSLRAPACYVPQPDDSSSCCWKTEACKSYFTQECKIMAIIMESSDENQNECEGYYDRVPKNQCIFDEEFGLLRHTKKKTLAMTKLEQMRLARKHCHPKRLLDFMPIFKWLPQYNVKENLIRDIIGGLTVGIMHVPQGMAYSSLAGVQPVNGLYTSLFPPLFYMLFGTSRHVSLGVFAVVSLMSGSCNQRVSAILEGQAIKNNGSLMDSLGDEAKMQSSIAIVTSLAMCVGLVQVAMAILRLDFLIAFLSDQIIGGFTTGAAVHVFTAQLNKIFGVPLPRCSGPGKLFFIYKALIGSIVAGLANWITFGISVCTIVLLFTVKTYLDPSIRKRCSVPVPYDLFVMIIGTIVSYLINLHDRFGVKIIGEIPTGLPAPSLPDVSLFRYFLSDAVAISVVVLVVTVSMGKLFAKKHKYEIDVRQEFYAMGFVEILSSFFPIWPSSTALARSLVYEAAGTKTQLGTIASSILLLAVILFIGPFVEVLPVCFLSCIIIVALKGMFMQLSAIPSLWPISKADCAIFVVSFLATVLYDVVEGLLIGTFFAAILLIYGIQSAKVVEIGRMSHNEGQSYFQPIEHYRDAVVRDGVCCVRFAAPIVYLNAERFKKNVDDVIQLPTLERRRREGETELEKSMKHCRNESGTTLRSIQVMPPELLQKQFSLTEPKRQPIRAIVIDLSAVPQIDYTGAQCLIEVFSEQRVKGITVFFAAASLQLLSRLELVLAKSDSNILANFYPSIDDALNNIK
ncbi:sulfate transporter and sulfate transporter antisigma-factor antagonist [Trichostrongylus colubriformis]|uniref:Sulfate transporter and sulfate transporter antisigma-factor antagonist n=1 Tax=Trichostrongylus colubriformis TaxID=6319 RepID=A0AAN8FIB2_TRICO